MIDALRVFECRAGLLENMTDLFPEDAERFEYAAAVIRAQVDLIRRNTQRPEAQR